VSNPRALLIPQPPSLLRKEGGEIKANLFCEGYEQKQNAREAGVCFDGAGNLPRGSRTK